MKRNSNQRKKIDNGTRHSRSDHGNSKPNNLFTPPIRKSGRNGGTGNGDSALLQRLEKITNEINTMQTYPNQQNQPPNQSNYPIHFTPHPQFGLPPGNPPSYSNASPRHMEYNVSGSESPRHMNDMGNGYGAQQQSQNLSPQHHTQPMPPFNQNSTSHQGSTTSPTFAHSMNQMEMTDMSLNMKSLQTSLVEAHEEHRRAMNRVEIESRERRTLEQQNFELNNKLTEARQAVKDTQAALQSAQFATDQLINKRAQREGYIKELSEVNNTNISRIATLEAKLKDADDGLLEGSNRRDQFIHQIQSQLTSAQEEVYGAQAEISALNGQKCQVETELDNWRERHRVLEQRLKDSESAIELTYKAKITVLEDKNQALMDKIAGEKHVYSQIQHLEEQLSHKSTALQRALENSKNAEVSLHESIGHIRNRDEVLLAKDDEIQQLQSRLVKLEGDMKKDKQAASQCKVLEAELGSKNTELKLVHQSLCDTQAELGDAMLKLETSAHEINDKNKDILDIDLKLKQALKMNMSERGFNEIISSMQTEITDMEGSLMSERSTRKAAEEDAETFQIKIRALEVTMREKMSVIVERESDVKSLQKIVNADQIKASRVEELEDKVHEVTHALNLEVQSNRMAKRELEKKDMKIQSLELNIQAKDKGIQDLEDTVKTHNVSEVSDRIMNSTIQQLETQLVERDGLIAVRNDKIKALDGSLQESHARARELEIQINEQSSEYQQLLFKKQTADRDAVKLKTSCQSLEGKLALIGKQNETLESRTKVLIFEKHEAVNKLEMLEKIVQDMAESTIDTASSVKEQQRLTEELSQANLQMTTLAADLEKSNVTIAVLRNSLVASDEEVKKLASQSHAAHVAKKAVNMMVANLRAGKEKKKKKSPSEGESSARKVVTPARSFMEGLSDSQSKDDINGDPSLSVQQSLNRLETSDGIMGRKHTVTSSLSEVTDFINATTRDIAKIEEKKKDLRVSVDAFLEEFQNRHGRQPTAEEKSAAPDKLFINYQQLSHILKKKKAKLADSEEQFKQLQQQGGN